jgi:peptidoglycan/LPS O-acetylase OafA/YrhL
MAHVYSETDFTKPANIWTYYLKRFAKIYPTYALSTVSYFLFFRDFTTSEHARILVNDLFLVQGFFPSMFKLGINGGAWSLTVEMFLYLLFPLVMIWSGKSPRIAIAGVILSISSSIFYSNRPLEYLDLISYSFYLWQFAAIELGKKIIIWLPWASLHLVVLAAFIMNVVLSALSYHLVEERARKWILRRFDRAGRAGTLSTTTAC